MEEMSLEEAKEILDNFKNDKLERDKLEINPRGGLKIGTKYKYYELDKAINTVLKELNNRISKDDLKNILRKVQDYQLNYKDTVLFNIIIQEIFGETEWTNLEDKE